MDHEQLVRRAGGGDVKAFVELTRRFQQFAFGSALALVRDFQHAEDVVQEAFVAAWSALPTLTEPAAFPGWLRGIVRHHAFRLLRRKRLKSVPLMEAEALPDEEPLPDHILEQRRWYQQRRQRAAGRIGSVGQHSLRDGLCWGQRRRWHGLQGQHRWHGFYHPL